MTMCLQCEYDSVFAMTKFCFQTLVHVCFVQTGTFPLPQQGHKKVITEAISMLKFPSELYSIFPFKKLKMKKKMTKASAVTNNR